MRARLKRRLSTAVDAEDTERSRQSAIADRRFCVQRVLRRGAIDPNVRGYQSSTRPLELGLFASGRGGREDQAFHVRITERMKKAFRITAKSVAAPLSFDQVRGKYGASAADVRAVRLFILADSAGGTLPVLARKKSRSSSASLRIHSKRILGTRKK